MARSHHQFGVASGLALMMMPSSAWAHPGHVHAPTFLEGLAHPLTGWDHMSLLMASGVAMALSIDADRTLGRREALGLLALFGGGVTVMLGNMVLGLTCMALAAIALLASTLSVSADRRRIARVGAIAAIGLQSASHFLASGDLVANVEFAVGFTVTSLAVFLCSYGMVRITRRLAVRPVRV